MSEAFITGSRAYGNPTPKSDLDLVIRVSDSTEKLLRELCEAGDDEPIRFGRLNLIPCQTDTEFSVWRLGTSSMKMDKKVTYNKEEAKRVFDDLRDRVGLLNNYEKK